MSKELRVSSTTNLTSASLNDLPNFYREVVDVYTKAGFDAIDINLNYFRRILPDDSERIMNDAAEYAALHGIAFELAHLPFGITLFDSAAKCEEFGRILYRAIDAAAIVRPRFAVVHPYTKTLPESESDVRFQLSKAVELLKPFVEYGRERGVELVVENMRPVPDATRPIHRYASSAEEICEIADALGIGICWDFGHANIRGLKQSEALKTVGSRLKMVHINDNFGADDEHLPPFFGKIDWADAMKGLSEIGFDGLLNYEVACRLPNELRENFALTLLAMAKTLNRLKNQCDR